MRTPEVCTARLALVISSLRQELPFDGTLAQPNPLIRPVANEQLDFDVDEVSML